MKVATAAWIIFVLFGVLTWVAILMGTGHFMGWIE